MEIISDYIVVSKDDSVAGICESWGKTRCNLKTVEGFFPSLICFRSYQGFQIILKEHFGGGAEKYGLIKGAKL